jgi:tetratricopeptide (TPR) repeat protein
MYDRMFYRFLVTFFVVLGVITPHQTFAEEPVIGVSLNTPQVWRLWKEDAPDNKNHFGAPAAMEFTRQAIFIAARDELGLITSDPSLGEPLERDGILPFLLELDLITGRGTETKLSQGDTVLIDRFIEHRWIVVDDHPKAAGLYESLSRGELLEALQKAGLKGEPNKWHDSAIVPDSIQGLVDEMSLVSQFRAARALHRLFRSDGESPERLWALSRVYANLGQECRWFLRCQFAAFQARSWLYAQRLSAKAPDSPYGQVARAYAWTLAGYPGYSEPIVEKLQVLQAERADNEGPADWEPWVELIDACNHYDWLKLEALMLAGDARSSVAAMWSASTYEFVDMQGLTFATIDKAIEANPLSTRILYSGYDAMGVRAGHWLTQAVPDHFAFVTTTQLARIDAAPDAVKALLPEPGREDPMSLRALSETAWAMQDLTAEGKDDGELSYGALGTLIDEANALHILYRAKFMRRLWSVDTTDYFRAMSPALSRHPYRPLILGYLFRKNDRSDLTRKLMASYEPQYLNGYHVHNFTWHLPYRDVPLANGWDLHEWFVRAVNADYQAGSEYIYSLRFAGNDKNRKYKVDVMGRFDLHHPKRIAVLLSLAKEQDEQFNQLVEDYGAHPLVADSLADYMMERENLEDAREYARIAAAAAPERNTLERLARIELLLGDELRWLTTMKLILKLPDHSLDHAKVNQLIAGTYMNQGRFEEALPYAKASGDSWASWALDVYMINLASLGRYEDALAIAQRSDERYRDRGYRSELHLMIWSGQADGDKVSRQYEDSYKNLDAVEFAWRMAYADFSLGRYEQAFKRIKASRNKHKKGPRELLFGVVAANDLGRDELRDQWLEQLIQLPVDDQGERQRFSLLAELMKQAIEKGEIDWDAAEKWTQAYDRYDIEAAFYLGMIGLEFAEGRRRALAELQELARYPDCYTDLPNTARALLRREGYTNEQMLPTGFYAHALPDKDID